MKLNKYSIIISVVIFMLSSFVAEESFAGTKKTLKRKIDHVIVAGNQCRDITGRIISNYGLYARKKGKLKPIPFQIDELNDGGAFVLTHGEEKSSDIDKGRFDANDQLVFMAKDTGGRISGASELPKTAGACLEIALTDPLNSRKAWVYFMSFPAPPVLSKIDYVNCNSGRLEIKAWNYIARFNEKHPVAPSYYAFSKRIGGDEKDILDRARVRIVLEKFITLNRTEEDIDVDWLGYIDGPVRVIHHTRNTTRLFLGIPASTTEQNIFFYFNQADFSLAVSLPIRLTRFQISVIDDFSRLKGWTYYSSSNPKGHIIDGIMDDSDKRLNLSSWKWAVISNDNLSFWFKYIIPPECPVTGSFYYNDDINAKDESEDIRGELPALGFEFKENWEKSADEVEFRLIHFFTKGYKRGLEKEIVNVHDRSLKITTKSVL